MEFGLYNKKKEPAQEQAGLCALLASISKYDHELAHEIAKEEDRDGVHSALLSLLRC